MGSWKLMVKHAGEDSAKLWLEGNLEECIEDMFYQQRQGGALMTSLVWERTE